MRSCCLCGLKIGVLSVVPQLENWYRNVYQKQLKVWVPCLISPFCHFKGAKLFICHLARDQCFKLEFHKETERDLEGGVFENCLMLSLFNVQFDHLTHGESSLGILVRI